MPEKADKSYNGKAAKNTLKTHKKYREIKAKHSGIKRPGSQPHSGT